ncbi:MAG: PDC sensor domain-containing protein [Halothiobacillaceae bacterium]
MADMSYLVVIEQYHEFRESIRTLLTSIITGIADSSLLQDQETQRKALLSMHERYPFMQSLYVLDEQGMQISEFVVGKGGEVDMRHDVGRGHDRRHRSYYQQAVAAGGVVVTEPYLSSVDSTLCLSGAMPIVDGEGKEGYLVIDVNLETLIVFLMGDTRRRRFEPVFKGIYTLIGISLLGVVGLLMFNALRELFEAVIHPIQTEHDKLRPFSIIIVITLAMAIFDLAKTTLEEEVLMHKDLFRYNSATRRTITRFLAAIIIAVSIEGLLLMFKSAMGATHNLLEAAFVMLSAAILTVGLGLYVYLGARAEALLPSSNRRKGHGKCSSTVH